MRYSVKVAVYKEGLPYNRWFQYKSCNTERVIDLMNKLGLEEKAVGVILVNDYYAKKNKVLKDKDSIRFAGKIYPEYL